VRIESSKCSEYDYINFLIASTKIFTCTEAARCQLIDEHSASHEAFTRLLQRQPPDTEALWNEVQPHVKKETGFLILDDSTLDKPYSQELALVYRHWSGKQHKVVNGINPEFPAAIVQYRFHHIISKNKFRTIPQWS